MTSSAETRETLTPVNLTRASGRPSGRRVAGSRRKPAGTPGGGPATTAGALRPGRRAPIPQSPGRKPDLAAPATTEGARPAEAVPRHPRRWPSALAALVALGLLVAAVLVSTRPALSQHDRDAAVGSARASLETLLSYSGAKFDAHVAEVTPRLASPFKEEFTKVATTDIKPMAVKNGATVLAKVYDAGVMSTSGTGADGSTVRVLAFVNQATTTKGQQTPQVDQNRVIATMEKVGDRWLISRLEAF